MPRSSIYVTCCNRDNCNKVTVHTNAPFIQGDEYLDTEVTRMDGVKGRYVLALIVISFFILPFAINFLWIDTDIDWYWIDIGAYYPIHLLDVAFILVAIRLVRFDIRALLGHWPNRREWRLLLHVDVLLFSMTSALTYAVYLPLSYAYPDFISAWLEVAFMPSVYLDYNESIPILANALGLISLAVLAPITEEILFRGFLLRRWASKWGTTRAIMASSLLFGVLHPEPIGAALFGIAMCLLYLRTGALWITIIAHSLNNAVIWLWEMYYVNDMGFDFYSYTLEDFRSEWWYGIVWAIIALAAAAMFLKPRPSGVRAEEPLT